MNFRVHVIAGRQLPIADANGTSDPYVIVLQDSLAKIQIGMTNVIPRNLNPTWNQSFVCHGIRGMRFKFEIFDFDQGKKHDKLGSAVFDPIFYPLNQEVWVPVYPAFDESKLPQGWQPALLIKVETMASQPLQSQFPGSPIPPNQTAYVNLAFAPAYKPPLPIQNYGLGYIPCPLDLGLISFGQRGELRSCVFNGETKGKGVKHSGINFCFCYDTYGPSLRLDLAKMFFHKKGKGAVKALITVSTNDPKVTLDKFQWIAVDFYLSPESAFQPFGKRVICRDPNQLQPFFHQRLSAQIQPGATVAVIAVLTITPQGVAVQPYSWCFPNPNVPVVPYSVIEVAPELAQICGFDPRFIKRRIAFVPGVPISINRALLLQGYNSLQLVRVGLGWDTKTDLDASVMIFDPNFRYVSTVSFSKLQEFGGAIRHSGDNRTGVGSGDDEIIAVNLPVLPPAAHYLCFMITSFNNVPFKNVKKCHLHLVVGENVEVFRINLSKSTRHTGLFFCVMYRASPHEWNVFPVNRFADANSPARIRPFIERETRKIFGVRY
ncbi:stress-induced protein [Histomonas meleagridis]|uniref:stress-induced protein n=1 Tax=Histomonas meleagridis TaxID=135588 RepID=UPI00355968ED|nr:stress-induced protein [Histomonas meleagridis]KAH0797891.1 stress-induced protein [Histomonas meleagridis]